MLLVDLTDSPPPVVHKEESTLGYHQKDLEHDADRAAPSAMGDEESLGVTKRHGPLTPQIQLPRPRGPSHAHWVSVPTNPYQCDSRDHTTDHTISIMTQ